MAGTLTISTLSDGTNSTSATNCISGSAKAWVYFNGSNGAISGSYNVSSVTRDTTGQYTVNMTNALVDTNYAIVPNGSNSGYGSSYMAPRGNGQSLTTSSFKLTGSNGANAIIDLTYCYVAVFR